MNIIEKIKDKFNISNNNTNDKEPNQKINNEKKIRYLRKNRNKYFYKRIDVRLSKDEYEKLINLKQQTGLSFSAMFIKSFLDKEKLKKFDNEEKEIQRKLFYELHKIGTNVNQIATKINTEYKEKRTIDVVATNLVLAEMLEMLKNLEK